MGKFLLICLMLCLAVSVHGQTTTQYDSVKFATPHVLEQPLTLAQDNKGQLWLITEQGVSLFNGESFTSYQTFNFEQPLVDAVSIDDTLILATKDELLLDRLTQSQQTYASLWQASTNEQIQHLYKTPSSIFIKTNFAIYQAELSSNPNAPKLSVKQIKNIRNTDVTLAVTDQAVFVLNNNRFDYYGLDEELWKAFSTDKTIHQITAHNNNFVSLDSDNRLFELSISNNYQAQFTLLTEQVERIYPSSSGTFIKQGDQLNALVDTNINYPLPLSAEQIFIDVHQNVWIMSAYDIQVLWFQALDITPTTPENTGRFSLITDNYALQQDRLYQKADNGSWQLRTRLPVAQNSKNMLVTDSRIWLQKSNRLVAVDTSTYVMSVDIPLSSKDIVLKHTNHSLLIVNQERLISANANGLQNELKKDCGTSCLPDYQVTAHEVTGDTIWLATNRGLHKFDLQTLEFSTTRLDHLNDLSPVLSVFNADTEHLWLVYPNKIAYWNKQNQTSNLFYSPENRLLDAELTAANTLKVVSQQGWNNVTLRPSSVSSQSNQSAIENILNLHKVELDSGDISYLAPNEVLNLTQTEEELRLTFNLTKQHPQQSVYFRFKYDDELQWSEALSFAQSITLKNLRQGENELQIQARVEGADWQPTRRFVYDMPYEYLQTKWVVVYGVALIVLALVVFVLERFKRFRVAFDAMKQQTFITSLLESTKDGVWVADKDREIQTINAAFEEITGLGLNDVSGKSFQISSDKGRNHEVESIIWQEVIKSGFWTGEVWSSRKDGQAISIDMSVTRVETSNQLGSKKDVKFVGVFSDVTQRKTSEKTMRHLATRDPLTDFANRTLFIELLERAIATANPHNPNFAIVFIDLDNFSKVNASLGPIQGDELLKLVALRLNSDLDKGVSIARLAGDEFALLIPNHLFIGEPEFYIRKVAAKIKRNLAPSFMLANTEVNIGASLGIAFYPHHGATPEALMRCADTALKKIKQAGKNNFCIYETAIDDSEVELLSLESELIRAFDNDEFTVNFQPKYMIKQHHINGFEALVRWSNPARGIVLPDKFIPLAEQNGLIRPLDTAVIKKVCQQIKQWQKQGFDFGHVAINISALNFQQMEFCQSIKQITREFDVDPKVIELEITESAMMSDPEQTHDNLVELRSLGFTVALDDFGTGHSSLGHLKNFPIDRIKIDRSFVKDIETSEQDKNIVSVIIQLAKFLEIDVVAEGVENQEQAYILHVLGCNDIQGFMISKALPANQIDEFMKAHHDYLPSVTGDS